MIGTPLPGAAIRVSDPIELDTFTTRPAELRRSSGSIALVTATTANTLVSERWERHRALVMDTDNETNLLLELSEPMELDMGRHGRQSVRTVALWADDQAQAATVIRSAAGAGGPDRG